MPRAKKPCRPRYQYRILGYDGSYRARDRTAEGSGGHRIQEIATSKEAAEARAAEWMDAYPPQSRDASLGIEEITTRTGDVYVVSRWTSTAGGGTGSRVWCQE